MKELEERLFNDIGMRYITQPAYVLMGDADWFELAKGLNTQVTYSTDATAKMDCIRFAGAIIYSNGMAGTRGWIVGGEEDIMRMRNAVWAAQYIYVFNGTADGMVALYGKLMNR